MLTKDEIQSLFSFCEKHSVRYYDMQVELVAQLSASIEGKMQRDPGLSFSQALDDTYQGFGRTGFASFLSEKETQMAKTLRHERWRILKSYFSWPKIGLVIILFAIFSLPVLIPSKGAKIVVIIF